MISLQIDRSTLGHWLTSPSPHGFIIYKKKNYLFRVIILEMYLTKNCVIIQLICQIQDIY